jgi:hypothetical protein
VWVQLCGAYSMLYDESGNNTELITELNKILKNAERKSFLPYVIGGFIIVGAAIAGVLVAMQRKKVTRNEGKKSGI